MWYWSLLSCCGPRMGSSVSCFKRRVVCGQADGQVTSERQPLLEPASAQAASTALPRSPGAEHDFPSPDTIITAPKPPQRMSILPPHERLRLQRERESGSSASRQRSTSGGSGSAAHGTGQDAGAEAAREGRDDPEGKIDRTDCQDRMEDISKFFSRRFQPLTRPGLPSSPSRTSAPPSAGVTRRDAPSPFTMVPLPRESRTVPASPAGQSRSAGPHATLPPAQERGQGTVAERRASSVRPAYVSAPPSARLPPPRRGLFDEHPIEPDSASEKSVEKDTPHTDSRSVEQGPTPAARERERRDSSAVSRAPPFITALLPHLGRSVSEPQSLQAHLHRRLSSLSASRSRSTSASAAALGLGGGGSITSPAPPAVDSPETNDADADSGALRFVRGYGPGRPAEIEGFAAHMLPMGKATDPRTVMVFRGRPRSSTGASATDRSAASRSRAGSSTGLAQAPGVGRPVAHDGTGLAHPPGRSGSAGGDDGRSDSCPSRPSSNDGRRRSVVSVHTAGWEEVASASATAGGGGAAGLGPGGAGRGYPGVSARRGRSPGPSRLGSRNVSADSLSMWRMDEVQLQPPARAEMGMDAQCGLVMGLGAAWEPTLSSRQREVSHGRRLEAIPGSEGAIALGSGSGSGGRSGGRMNGAGTGDGAAESASGGRRDRRRASPVFSLEGDEAPISPTISEASRVHSEQDVAPDGPVVRLQMGLELFGRPLPHGMGGGAGQDTGMGMRQTRSAEPMVNRAGAASMIAAPAQVPPVAGARENDRWSDVVDAMAGDTHAHGGRSTAAERYARGRARRGGRSASRRGGSRRGGGGGGSGGGRGASVLPAGAAVVGGDGRDARSVASASGGALASASRGRGMQRRFVSD